MIRIRAEIVIDAPPDRVWATIENVENHVEWMADAREIRFRGDQRSGTGTVIECDTRIGPLRTTDVMRFTRWDPGERMGVFHTGVITGEDEFVLEETDGRTRFVWQTDLRFPRRLGGDLTGSLARPVMRRLWRGNLRRLKRIVESGWG